MVYRVLGRPKGRMMIGRIIGHSGSTSVEEALFNACQTGGSMSITATPSACASQPGGVIMTFSGIFVVNYGVSINVGDKFIREQVDLAFTSFNRTIL
jgi:hypothetical protein